MGIKTVPVVGARHWIPAPVGRFEVVEDDASVLVEIRGLAPHVEVASWASRRCAPRTLEPGGSVGGMVEDQLRDHAQTASMGLAKERPEIAQRAAVRMDARVIGDVVAIVA